MGAALWVRQRTRHREVIDRLLSFVDHQCQSFGLRLLEHLAEDGPQLARLAGRDRFERQVYDALQMRSELRGNAREDLSGRVGGGAKAA